MSMFFFVHDCSHDTEEARGSGNPKENVRLSQPALVQGREQCCPCYGYPCFRFFQRHRPKAFTLLGEQHVFQNLELVVDFEFS